MPAIPIDVDETDDLDDMRRARGIPFLTQAGAAYRPDLVDNQGNVIPDMRGGPVLASPTRGTRPIDDSGQELPDMKPRGPGLSLNSPSTQPIDNNGNELPMSGVSRSAPARATVASSSPATTLPSRKSAPIHIVGAARNNPQEIPTITGGRAIPLPQDATAPVINFGQAAMPQIGSNAPRPQVMSSGGIPVTPRTSSGIIPTNPATGEAEQVNNKGIPIKAGIAGLWAKADNIHNPVLRVLGKVGTGALKAIDIAGQAVLPSVEKAIPGSSGYERAQEDRKLAKEKEQAQTGLADAQTEHLKSETALAGVPKAKEEEWSVVPSMTGPNGEIVQQEKNSGTIRFAPDIKGAKPLKTPAEKEGEMPLGDKVSQANKMLEQRWQVRHPGQPLSPTYTLPPTATQKDYDRIDKALEAEERANGSKAQQDTANEMRRQTFEMMKQAHADSATQHGTKPVLAYDKDNKAHLLSAEEAKAAGLTGVTEATPKQIDDAKTHTVVLNDMQTKLNDVVAARGALDQGADQRAIISKVLAHAEPGVINDQINKFALSNATQQTKEYVQAVQSLKESALGLPKEITGGSRTSEIQGNALFQTLPTGASLDSKYALEQSKKFQANIDRLRERVPQVRGLDSTSPHSDLGASGGANWSAPKDAPPAPAEDGHQLKKDGRVLAVSKGGKWARP